MNEDVGGIFRGGAPASGSGGLPWQLAGRGDLVVDLVIGARPSRFHGLLAERFQVASLDVPNFDVTSSEAVNTALAALTAATGQSRCSLIVRGAALPLALRVLQERPGLISALVLLAPSATDNAGALEALSAAGLPLLVLSGTRGDASPPEAGSRFRAHIGSCHYVLVYDAGDTIEADRPEATASVVGDFLDRREKFIVAHASGLLHP